MAAFNSGRARVIWASPIGEKSLRRCSGFPTVASEPTTLSAHPMADGRCFDRFRPQGADARPIFGVFCLPRGVAALHSSQQRRLVFHDLSQVEEAIFAVRHPIHEKKSSSIERTRDRIFSIVPISIRERAQILAYRDIVLRCDWFIHVLVPSPDPSKPFLTACGCVR